MISDAGELFNIGERLRDHGEFLRNNIIDFQKTGDVGYVDDSLNDMLTVEMLVKDGRKFLESLKRIHEEKQRSFERDVLISS